MSAPPPRTASTAFRPRFTLSLFYLAFFFMAYALLLAAPELSQLVEPAAEQDEQAVTRAASQLTREVVGPRLPFALLLAIATLFVGVKQGWLPGTRPPGAS